MSDRELLELAAKAAKMEPLCWSKQNHGARAWDPLFDDGDALRLAVKLGIDLMFGLQMMDGVACMTAMFPLADDWDAVSEPTNDNLQAATRRAIVRAAAEIGKGMP